MCGCVRNWQVFLYYDTMKYYSQNTRNQWRENLAKLQVKKNNAKSFLAKNPPNCRSSVKQQKATKLCSVVFSFLLGKGLLSQDFIRFWKINYIFGLSAFIEKAGSKSCANQCNDPCHYVLHFLASQLKI